MGEYKVGTISDILRGEGGGNVEVDPNLAKLFGGAKGAVFRTVRVKEEQIVKKRKQEEEDGGGQKRREEVKLRHKDAAEIRVQAKRKVKAKEEVDEEEEEEIPVKSKKKKRKQNPEAVEPISPPKKVKKKKQKKEAVEVKEESEVDIKEESDEEPAEVQVGETSTFKTLEERNAPKPKDPALEARTLFVGNIPGDTKKKQVHKMFQRFGAIETVRYRGGAPAKPTQLKKVAVNKKELHADKNTLTAYIRYKTREEAVNASKEGRGLLLQENHLVVDLVVGEEKKDLKKAVFVGNLHLKMTDEELWRFFEDCGSIASVRVIRDNATGMGKGFGYVNFETREAVDQALQKNQEELKGRNLRVSRCVKKLKDKTKKKKKGGGAPPGKEGKGARKFFDQKKKGRGGSGPPAGEDREFSGDKLAEIGKLKRRKDRPNRGEMKKARIAKLLTGNKGPRTVNGAQKKKRNFKSKA